MLLVHTINCGQRSHLVYAGAVIRPVLCRLKDVYAEKDKIIPENEKWLLCRFCSGAALQAEFDIYVVFSGKDFDEFVCCLTDGDGNVISCVDK